MSQESFALGAAHVVGSTMSCGGLGISSPRLLMMASSGGKTQMSYVIASLTSLIIVVFLASSASSLPSCVVAVIIIASFGKSSSNFSRLRKYWRSDRLFLAMWLFTFSACTIFNISDGLLYGVIFTVLLTAVRTVKSPAMKMEVGSCDGQEYYLPTKYYSKTTAVQNSTKVIAINGAIFFGNSTTFKGEIINMVKSRTDHPATSTSVEKKLPNSDGAHVVGLHVHAAHGNDGLTLEELDIISKMPSQLIDAPQYDESKVDHHLLILDFNWVPFIDTSTIRVLISLKNELSSKYLLTLRLCNCNVNVYDDICKSRSAFNKLDGCIYLTLEDALSAAPVGWSSDDGVNDPCDSDNESSTLSEVYSF